MRGLRTTGSPIDFTVAICTRDRAELLHQTLRSIREARVPAGLVWELLVVNNGSQDRTSEVVREFADLLPVREAHEAAPGIASARNRAIESACGAWLLFTDDDVIVSSDWLDEFWSGVRRHPDAAVFAGAVEPWFADVPREELAAAFPELARGFCGLDHGVVERALAPTEDVVGANLGINLERLGSMRFDPSLGHRPGSEMGGEETEFLARVRARGATAIWLPRMRLKHYVPRSRMTLAYLQGFVVGQGRKQVRLEGIGSARRVFGAPRWLWSECGKAYAAYAGMRLRGDRVGALRALRLHWILKGMLLQTRELAAGGER